MAAGKTQTKAKETFAENIRHQVETRLEEIRPVAAEAQELEQMLEGMGTTKKQPRRGGGRRRRNGGRSQEFLKLVQDKPGITVGEASKKLDINPNYLYRVAGELVKDEKVTKEGQGYVPVPGATEEEGDDE